LSYGYAVRLSLCEANNERTEPQVCDIVLRVWSPRILGCPL
jgi:hypothetical protein